MSGPTKHPCYPVLHSAFWLEHRIWGGAAAGYHLANVLLHAASACLLAAILGRWWPRSGAWLAALLFVLHPVCAESVAWIAEQKNTLSTAFYLAAALAYLRFDEERKPRWYLAGLGLFALALLSKSVTASLPAALLVVFWWRRGRLSWNRDVLPLLPWFTLGAATGLFTAWVERRFIGAQGAAFTLTFVERCLVAGRAIWFYLGQLLWPANLIFIYPHWTVNASEGWQYLYPLLAAALLAGLWLIRKRTRAPLAACLFFVGSLFPTLGFLNVYAFIFSYVADHWQYLASLGVIVPTAGLALALDRAAPPIRAVVRAGVILLLGILGTLTWRQAERYHDATTFYQAILARNPRSWMAHNNLGLILAEKGEAAGAEAQYRLALPDAPDYADLHFNLGKLLWRKGRMAEAEAQFRETARIAPADAETHEQLGTVLGTEGRIAEAVQEFETAVRLVPGSAEEHDNLGIALGMEGSAAAAIGEFGVAVRLQPENAKFRRNLGVALQAAGRDAEAQVQFLCRGTVGRCGGRRRREQLPSGCVSSEIGYQRHFLRNNPGPLRRSDVLPCVRTNPPIMPLRLRVLPQLLLAGLLLSSRCPGQTAAQAPFLLDVHADDKDQVGSRADAALAAPVVSLMDRKRVSPVSDPHEYVSYATYWWPDPSKPDGRPFIRQDGHHNTAQTRQGDRSILDQMYGNVRSLSVGWAVLHREAYAQRAGGWLRAWFVTPTTRMAPDLEYSQVQLGHDHDRGAGTPASSTGATLPRSSTAFGSCTGRRPSPLPRRRPSRIGSRPTCTGCSRAPTATTSTCTRTITVPGFSSRPRRSPASAARTTSPIRSASRIAPGSTTNSSRTAASRRNCCARTRSATASSTSAPNSSWCSSPLRSGSTWRTTFRRRAAASAKDLEYLRPFSAHPETWKGHAVRPPRAGFLDAALKQAAGLGIQAGNAGSSDTAGAGSRNTAEAPPIPRMQPAD